MTALLRYAFLKSGREMVLAQIILTPIAAIATFSVAIMAFALVNQHSVYPVQVPGTSAAGTLVGFIGMARLSAALAAGTAAFWLFRKEIGDHSIASFVVASSSRPVVAASIVFGTLCGLVAFVLGAMTCVLFAASVPDHLGLTLTRALITIVLTSGVAILCASISSDFGMWIPVGIVAFILTVDSGWMLSLKAFAILTILFVTILFMTSRLLERRCAG
jgi:hypothetical protein